MSPLTPKGQPARGCPQSSALLRLRPIILYLHSSSVKPGSKEHTNQGVKLKDLTFSQNLKENQGLWDFDAYGDPDGGGVAEPQHVGEQV